MAATPFESVVRGCHPIGMSGTRSEWTIADVPSQVGRRALITGGNSGIGFHTGLELARKGCSVVLACRDVAKGERAVQRIQAEVAGAEVEVLRLDLASLASVRAAANAELGRAIPLDLLINNAGVCAPKTRRVTQDGFELQFGTNVLGHFALTALLLPALERAAAIQPDRPRVVTIASIAHQRARMEFDDLQSERSYKPMGSYGRTKLANLMFALELERRLRAAGEPVSRVISVAAHPGLADTNLFKGESYPALERMVRNGLGILIKKLFNSTPEGALPTLYAATWPDATGGYYGPQGWREMRGGDAGPAAIFPQARDEAAAARLWSECERMTGTSLL